MRILFTVYLALITFVLIAQDFVFLPTSTTSQIVYHKYYSLSYSEKDEQPEWVAYKLSKEMVIKKVDRSGSFKEDKTVKTGSATNEDYKGSGYDKGHLCPAGDMSFSETAMKESFFLSNISPQLPGFNRGIWKTLEEQVRDWAEVFGLIYVVTGPVLMNVSTTIGENKVSVPLSFYKIVLDNDKNDLKVLAFIFPNDKCLLKLTSYLVSVDSVEKVTGIDFFPSLPDSIENSIEAKIDETRWGIGNITDNINKDQSVKQLKDKATDEKYNGYPVFIGPKGGKYYINDKGEKIYIKEK